MSSFSLYLNNVSVSVFSMFCLQQSLFLFDQFKWQGGGHWIPFQQIIITIKEKERDREIKKRRRKIHTKHILHARETTWNAKLFVWMYRDVYYIENSIYVRLSIEGLCIPARVTNWMWTRFGRERVDIFKLEKIQFKCKNMRAFFSF